MPLRIPCVALGAERRLRQRNGTQRCNREVTRDAAVTVLPDAYGKPGFGVVELSQTFCDKTLSTGSWSVGRPCKPGSGTCRRPRTGLRCSAPHDTALGHGSCSVLTEARAKTGVSRKHRGRGRFAAGNTEIIALGLAGDADAQRGWWAKRRGRPSDVPPSLAMCGQCNGRVSELQTLCPRASWAGV